MINPLFGYNRLNETGLQRTEAVRIAFTDLLEKLEQHCGPSREISLVRTKLEECSFFAINAIAGNKENQL